MFKRFRYLVLFALLLLFVTACQSAYYGAWEKVGVHKRDILIDRVENARDAQNDAQEQFKSALEEFSALVNFDGGNLQRMYDRLNSEYESSLDAASEVSDRIHQIEKVAGALFREWKGELKQYSNANLRADSARKLKATERKYGSLIKTMKKAEKRMQPVLTVFNDNVLYLKHNLNARAIGALKGEFGQIKRNIDILVADMNKSIQSSNDFIKTLRQ